MMLSRIFLASSLWFFSPSVANDTIASVASHEIVFQKTNDISMKSEHLDISLDQIAVEYEFYNHADKDLSYTIVFPLPPSPKWEDLPTIFPSWDEDYQARRFLKDNGPVVCAEPNSYHRGLGDALSTAAFVNFSRKVNGENYGFDCKVIALTEDKRDITQTLLKYDIPLSLAYLRGIEEEGELSKNHSLKKKLKKLKLLDKTGIPIWRNQTLYYWNQSFPSKKSIQSTHTYRPHPSLFFIKSIKDIKDFPPDQVKGSHDIKALEEITHLKDQDAFPIRMLEYILTTANNWKGPIKNFTLTIHVPENCAAFLSWPGNVSYDESTRILRSEIENFQPKDNLKIYFIPLSNKPSLTTAK